MSAVFLLVGILLGSLGTALFLLRKISSLKSELRTEKILAEKEKETRATIQEMAKLEFENLAGKIFDEKSRQFADKNRESLDSVLRPLTENLSEFKKAVDQNREKSVEQHSALKTQIEILASQAKSVGEEAGNLAKALKGDSKMQGDWGETVLASILERSGLQKDREYFTQESITTEAGIRQRPDVLVKLPDERCIVIDSKVSLTAYERYFNTEDENVRKLSQNEHLASVKKHIDELAGKRYEVAQKGSLDFTMMFVPIEPAYLLAIRNDPELWNYAYRKNILLVSPTNLVACIRIVADLWRRAEQDRNAQKIAEQGSKLYEKFVGFLETFVKIGNGLKSANESYEKAFKQLKDGRGNLIGQSEALKKLGVQTSKALPKGFEDADPE